MISLAYMIISFLCATLGGYIAGRIVSKIKNKNKPYRYNYNRGYWCRNCIYCCGIYKDYSTVISKEMAKCLLESEPVQPPVYCIKYLYDDSKREG